MGQIDVTADLILTVDVVSNEDDSGHTSIAYKLLTFGKRFQERAVVNLAAGV